MTDRLEGIAVGTELPVVVTESVRADDIKLFALILRDPNPIHFDLEAVRSAGLGERAVNQGGATMAYVANYLADWGGSRAAIRSLNCSFRGNVFAGDDVAVGATVTSVAWSSEGMTVECDVWADVVGGRRAISGSAVLFLNL